MHPESLLHSVRLELNLVFFLFLVFFCRLVTGGIPVGHFSHVFIDEAGQAEEPQCVIAIAGNY